MRFMRTSPAGGDFNLWRFFLVTSVAAALCILVLTTLSVTQLFGFAAIEIAEEDAVQIAEYLRDRELETLLAPEGDGIRPVPEETFAAFDRRMRDFLTPLRIIKIKIFNQQTEIIYSTDHTILGKTSLGNAKLEQALAGRITSSLEDKEKVWDLEDEERFGISLIETYVPLTDAAGTIVGSFEVYVDVTSIAEHTFSAAASSAMIVLTVLLLVFGGLGLLMRRADRTIRAQVVELRESQTRLETILRIIPHGIVTADAKGRIETVNIAMEPLFGHAEEDLIGKKVTELIPEQYREAHDKGLHHVAITGESKLLGRCLELEGQHSSGEIFPLELTLANWSAAGKQHFTGILQDITKRKAAEQALEDSEQRFKDFADSASDWLWEMDADLRFSYFSEQLHLSTGLDPLTVIGKTRRELGNPDLENALWKAHLATLDAHQPFQDFKYLVKNDQGNPIYMNVNGMPVFDDTGNFKGFRGTGSNITIHVLAEERANRARTRLHESIQNIPEGIALFDANDELILCNKMFRTVYSRIEDFIIPGVLFETLTRKLVAAGYFPDAKDREEEWIAHRLQRHASPGEPTELPLNDGRILLAQEYKTAEGGTLIIRSDITERKRNEEIIIHMARHDGLTDLPNRALCMDRLEVALAFARRHKTMCGVLFVDLDGFKAVNDGLGHESGDSVLLEVSRRLCDAVRESDTVGRIGGDEFLVVLNEVADRDAAAMVAQRLIDSLSEPIMVDKQRASIGASVGISLYPEHAGDPMELLNSADKAMYKVKERGKNSFEFAVAATA
ncbi:MAG: hypothetical protein DRQ37_02070 [Gammaproteobacteria bacterium]|nr:MAG: hypothetical protein DRQ37_02070 [Gammaproteobacteria bacterium]